MKLFKKIYVKPKTRTAPVDPLMQSTSIVQPEEDPTPIGAKGSGWSDDNDSKSSWGFDGASWIVLIMAFIISSCGGDITENPNSVICPGITTTPTPRVVVTLESFSLDDLTRAAFDENDKLHFHEGDSMLVFTDENKAGDKGVWYRFVGNRKFEYDPARSSFPATGNTFTFVHHMGNMESVTYKDKGSVSGVRVPQYQIACNKTFDKTALPFIGMAEAEKNPETGVASVPSVKMYPLGAYVKVKHTAGAENVTDRKEARLGNLEDKVMAADAIDVTLNDGKVEFEPQGGKASIVSLKGEFADYSYMIVLPIQMESLNNLYFHAKDKNDVVYIKKASNKGGYEFKNNIIYSGFNFDIAAKDSMLREVEFPEIGLSGVSESYVGAKTVKSYGDTLCIFDSAMIEIKDKYPGYRLMTKEEAMGFTSSVYKDLYDAMGDVPVLALSADRKFYLPYGGGYHNQGRQWVLDAGSTEKHGALLNDNRGIQYYSPSYIKAEDRYSFHLIRIKKLTDE